MTTYRWTIWAHSPQTNHTLAQVNLDTANVELNQVTAQQWADAFAAECNSQGRMQATDWQGVAKYEPTGVASLPAYQFHKPIV